MAQPQARKRPTSEPTATPSSEIVGSSLQELDVRDSRARTLTVRKIGPRKRMMIFAAIGAELSQNQMYWGTAMLACAVVMIDGEHVPQPTSRREIEALVDRLGEEGLEAAGKAIQTIMGVEIDDKGQVVSVAGEGADELATAKN